MIGPALPRRKVELVLKIGADSFRELENALSQLAFHAAVSSSREEKGESGIEVLGGEGLSSESSCGGFGYGWNYSVRADGLPHDAYFRELARVLDERRAATEEVTT